MIIAIDIGNTDVVIGFYEKEEWRHILRMPSNLEMDASEYEKRLRVFLLEEGIELFEIEKVILGSVVPDLTPVILEVFDQFKEGQMVLVDGELLQKLSLGRINPYELGADLAANAVGVFTMCQQSAIVVDFGTALTFTSVNNQGEIVGVAIAPGVQTAMKSLSSNTAKLPEIPLKIPAKALGNNTVEAMQAGIMQGYVGLVRHMVAQVKAEMGGQPKVIATGGLSFIFEPLHDLFDEMDVNLTLDGLRAMLSKLA
ncbi:type III pantothenate kinase [Reichenbachiella carrageenanivorans]|uniref:Type III pantothenate kinase n=1 Tax=Reichenbachiella carrageenanivorans TaxID=2979869 RepID=A0ABY6D067_9BACT|nr:type III pantothenate kinase [Reichenbachiella carrageenanivorans]UXX79329.1 type III pantothenate kinase [Reichenbachiella carrageenanivorans]